MAEPASPPKPAAATSPPLAAPDAAAAVAQSRSAAPAAEEAESSAPASLPRPCDGEGHRFIISARATRLAATASYERARDQPLYRPLRLYPLDPSVPKLEGGVATVLVPFETLEPGPIGALFEVDPVNGETGQCYQRADLDTPRVLMQHGYAPAHGDPRFHQQMTYAVCSLVYAAFKKALGRDIAWGFPQRTVGSERPERLRIQPHAFEGANAYYDPSAGALCFGYHSASENPGGRNLPGGTVFTCLSHDIVAHEVTHALLGGLRARFDEPTSADVLAFHEAFADLVAIFQHFTYGDVVGYAVRRWRGDLAAAEPLVDLARQLGETMCDEAGEACQSLRSAVDKDSESPERYDPGHSSPHARGNVVVKAVFDAFIAVFRRKTHRYLRLASGGTGILPPGDLPDVLCDMLAETATNLASQFLTICIRAIDYCPPIDVRLGEYLRALLTADYDLVPEDRWSYREALIDGFRQRGIPFVGVDHLSEAALVWEPPWYALAEDDRHRLAFRQRRFGDDPGQPADRDELRRQACTLGHIIARPENLRLAGLAHRDDPALQGDLLDPPQVESIRSSRRVGPSGQVVFDLVAEITQRRHVRRIVEGETVAFSTYGGATLIIGPSGRIRYSISKSVLHEGRIAEQVEFVRSEAGRRFWQAQGEQYSPRRDLYAHLHEAAEVA